MITIFKRRKPEAEPARVSTADRLIAAHSGYIPEQWEALPALVKADKREQVAWELREVS